MYLIDWEYAGMADPGCDIGTFIACSDYTPEEAEQVIARYLGHAPTGRSCATTSAMWPWRPTSGFVGAVSGGVRQARRRVSLHLV